MKISRSADSKKTGIHTWLMAGNDNILSSVVFAAAVFIPALLFSMKSNSGTVPAAYTVLWCLFAGILSFFMALRDRVSMPRLVFFAVSAAAFLLHFNSMLHILSPALTHLRAILPCQDHS